MNKPGLFPAQTDIMNSAALNFQCFPQISCCICQQQRQERKVFSVLWFTLWYRETSGSFCKNEQRNEPEGDLRYYKASEEEHHSSEQEPSRAVHFFYPIFVVFHLASDALFLSNPSVRETENMNFQHVLSHTSSRLSISQPHHLIGYVFNRTRAYVRAFAWHCSMCISWCPISFGMMCSSLISFLTPLQCDGNPSRHHHHCHFKLR